MITTASVTAGNVTDNTQSADDIKICVIMTSHSYTQTKWQNDRKSHEQHYLLNSLRSLGGDNKKKYSDAKPKNAKWKNGKDEHHVSKASL